MFVAEVPRLRRNKKLKAETFLPELWTTYPAKFYLLYAPFVSERKCADSVSSKAYRYNRKLK
jgi:hypothetical protein